MEDHDHEHDHQEAPSDPALRVMALESLLVEKGLVDPAALDALIDTYEHKIGPRNGARVVARAWLYPEFKERLLIDASSAVAELGYVSQGREHLVGDEPEDPRGIEQRGHAFAAAGRRRKSTTRKPS